MAQAQDLISAALRLDMVLAGAEGASTEELANGLDSLNRMIGGWNDSVQKSLAGTYAAAWYTFTPIGQFAALTTPVTVSQGVQRTMVYNLAVEVAAEYGREVSQTVAAVAGQTKMALLSTATPVI